MSPSDPSPRRRRPGRKVRVPLRRNRGRPGRIKDWTRRVGETDDAEIDAKTGERVAGKGDLSRHRTVIVGAEAPPDLRRGTVVALRGAFCDVDDGARIWPCTVRRILRTRLTGERHPVATGDIVGFRPASQAGGGADDEGVIETVADRRSVLQRKVKKRVHTMVANVDQVIIVNSADQPPPKPHLIDRYIVAALAGGVTPVISLNKIDLFAEAEEVLDRYRALGYQTLVTSAVTGRGIDALREALAGRSSAMVGQSGVGKSAMLNAVQPGLGLKVAEVAPDTGKGRHTTTTATLIKLQAGGYIVDTPGVRSLDLSMVEAFELEQWFVEFPAWLAHCKFADCTHTHEEGCAVKSAVEAGAIHPERYESYVRLYQELSAP